MQVENIAIDQLSISKANMQQGKKPHDVSDILPSIIKRGVIIPVIVRPNCDEGHFEICAGKRRYYASLAAQAAGKEDVTLPCIQIAANNDAGAGNLDDREYAAPSPRCGHAMGKLHAAGQGRPQRGRHCRNLRADRITGEANPRARQPVAAHPRRLPRRGN